MVHNFKDITGQRFNRLIAVEYVGHGKFGNAIWRCVCDCGKTVNVDGKSLRSGNTKSCGCLNRERSTSRIISLNTTHGKTNTRLYTVWSSMKTRCENPKATNYADYGARGIRICDEWRNNFESFYEWAMQHGYDPDAKRGDYTIDRVDNAKGYSPDNCRIVSIVQQANNRRNTRFITYNGTCRSLAEWARFYGRHVTLFEHMNDNEIIERIAVYEAYKQKNGVDVLPRRVKL